MAHGLLAEDELATAELDVVRRIGLAVFKRAHHQLGIYMYMYCSRT